MKVFPREGLSRLRQGVILGVAALGTAALGVLATLLWPPAVPALAQPPWPTPPPHPAVPPPVIIPPERVKPVPVPQVQGATVWLLQPLPRGVLPRVPPLPGGSLISQEADPAQRIVLRLEWESLPATLHLLYHPLPHGQAPPPPAGYRLLRAFALRGYNAEAQPFTPTLRRPWVLRVPLAGLPGAPDPHRLFLAQWREESGRWHLLTTVYNPSARVLETRLLALGLYAVLEEPALGEGGR